MADDKLNHRHPEAIAALLTCPTVEEAARTVGVSDRTIREWMKLPDFMAAYRQARREVVEAAIGRLQQATNDAVTTLTRNLTCGKPASEIRAGLGILDRAINAVQVLDLADQLAELQRQIEEVRNGCGNGNAGAGSGEAPGGPGAEDGASESGPCPSPF